MARSPWLVSIAPKRLKPAAAVLVGRYRSGVKRVQRVITRWFPPPQVVAHIPIKEFLRDAHNQLLQLQRRQYLLEAIDADWGRVTRGKQCWLHDDAAFRAIIDTGNMNVIDLCSWGVGVSDTGESLLMRVRDHYLAELPPKRAWAGPNESPSFSRALDEGHVAARARLFPQAQGRALTEADAEDLIEAFEMRIAPLRDDRNKNRAHAYENKTQGTAKLLHVAEVREMYRYARQVLNDLCVAAFGETWGETDVTSNNVDMTAEDLLDVVLLPQWFRRETQHVSRRDVYEALHAEPGPENFNDLRKLRAVADRIGTAR